MITIKNLTKRYGGTVAVDDISFRVEPGSVTGFLGPNGAGKTTTMRCLVGVTRPNAGEALVFDRHYAELPNPAARVGVLLDASAVHGGRTGRETLRLSAIMLGVPLTRVDQVLEMVGLSSDEAKKRIRTYSLGMQQRLGLAHAFLGNPEVLVLDEPANGLDPHGMHALREILRDFANAGGVVLLSSHLLHEVQQIADRIVMIGNGRIVAEGTIADLTGADGDLEAMFLELTKPAARGGVLQ